MEERFGVNGWYSKVLYIELLTLFGWLVLLLVGAAFKYFLDGRSRKLSFYFIIIFFSFVFFFVGLDRNSF